MKFLDKLIRKSTKTASVEVKKEVRKTAVDLLPYLVMLLGTAAGILLFKSGGGDGFPMLTSSRSTINNYFIGDVGEETIRRLLEGKKYE